MVSVVAQDWMDKRGLTAIDISGAGGIITHDKIVFPVHGPNGMFAFDVIRDLTGESARYDMNPAFCRPSHTLYNMARAISWIQKTKFVVVVEGVADCISLHKQGIPAVAAITSQLKKVQYELLRPYVKTILIWGDDDAPGLEFSGQEYEGVNFQGLVVTGGDPADHHAKARKIVGMVKRSKHRWARLDPVHMKYEHIANTISEDHNIR